MNITEALFVKVDEESTVVRSLEIDHLDIDFHDKFKGFITATLYHTHDETEDCTYFILSQKLVEEIVKKYKEFQEMEELFRKANNQEMM